MKKIVTEKEKGNLTKEEIEIAKARKLEILMLPILRRNIKKILIITLGIIILCIIYYLIRIMLLLMARFQR